MEFFSTSIYFRWLANHEKPFAGINTLKDEIDGKKLFEITVRYKEIVWTMNYSKSDLNGHLGKRSDYPHYHIAMEIDNLAFIKFSEVHIPFSDSDLFTLAAVESGEMVYQELYGAGVQDLFNDVNEEELLESLTVTNKRENEVINLQTIVEADEGKTIKGQDIVKLQKESKKTGVPIARLLKRLGYKMTVVMSPGEAIPKIMHRTERKR